MVAEILYAGEMRTWWTVLVLAACPAPDKPPVTPKLEIAATATATLDRDAAAMLELVRALYEEVGITVADNLTLDLQGLATTRSAYDDALIRITLPTPITSPDQARAYWQAWEALTGAQVEIADDVERYRLARFAVFVALAHEVGHFLHHSYVGPLEPAARELFADRLAIALLDRLAVRPELAELVGKYRALLAKWYAAIPARIEIPATADLDRWVAEHPLPADPAALASLSLARQLRLLAKPPKLADLAKTLLANPARKLEYGPAKLVVTTGRDVPAAFTRVTGSGTLRELATALLDADGKFHSIACSSGICEITGETGDAKKLVLANVLGDLAGFDRVHDVAINGDKLWLLLGGDGDKQPAGLTIIDLARPDGGKPTATWQLVTGGRLAVSPSGAVSVMLLRANAWTIERFEPAKTASWTFRIGEADVDGVNGVAGGTLGDCTSNDAGTIYCAAGFRIRVLDKDRMWTLAGGNRDWVDAADAKKVAFTSPVRLRATQAGLVLVDRKYGDDGNPTWKVRQIELKK